LTFDEPELLVLELDEVDFLKSLKENLAGVFAAALLEAAGDLEEDARDGM
jgi:hypothetical protein